MAPSAAAKSAAFEHSGPGPQNINSGDGEQCNPTISGGSGHVQNNARRQTFIGLERQSPEELDIEFRKKLFVTNPTIDRNNLIDTKHEIVGDTCDWILTTTQYQAWFDRAADRLLWVWGEPGKGKTMLSIFISQKLEVARKTVYFFCSAESEDRRTATAVLRGLIWHLTGLFPELVRAFRERCGSSMDDAVLSRETLWVEFARLVAAVSSEHIYCVVDGLDECDQDSQDWLARKFVSLENGDDTPPHIQVLITSREVSGLRCVNKLSLDSDCRDLIDNAVRVFVEVRTGDLFRGFPFTPSRRSRIKGKLFRDAKGSFLWVGFALIELIKQRCELDVMEVLEKLPPGLFKLYDRMWSSIASSRQNICTRILEYLSMACRALTLQELVPLVGCWPHADSLITETQLRDLIGSCAPLFRITDQTVRLVHESLRDYIKNRVLPTGARFMPEKTHAQLAEACILSFTQRESPLAQYARSFWLEHAREADRLAKHLIPHVSFLFDPTSHVKTLLRLPLHFACMLRIKAWVVDILETRNTWFPLIRYVTPLGTLIYALSPKPLSDLDDEGQTALHIAATTNQDAIVEMLLDHGASVHTANRAGLTALHLAIRAGRKRMMELLLDHGSDIYRGDFNGRTVLHMAASMSEHMNQKTAVELIFDRERKQ